MTLPDDLGRVAGIAVTEDGAIGAVWLAYDKPTDTAYIVDAAILDLPLVRIAEGLNARGRQIAVAWSKPAKSVADELLHEGGCNMVPAQDAIDDSLAAVSSKAMAARLKSTRLVVDPRVKEWSREYEQWQRSEAPVPESPLLCATRYALERLDYARPRKRRGPKQPNHPEIAIL